MSKTPQTIGTRRGNGPGWGGPQSGIPAKGKAPIFTAGNKAAVGSGKDLIKKAHKIKVKKDKAARIEQLTDFLCDLALNGDNQGTQLSATIAALNRLEGMPEARNTNKNVEMSFEDLVKESLKPKGKK